MANLNRTFLSGDLAMQQKGIELEPGQCDSTVYDEAFPNPEQQLVDIVDKFAQKGISVHYQSVESMADEGFVGGNDAELNADGQQYATDIILGCRWDESNSITVLISGDPRYYDIVTSGEQQRVDVNRPEIFSRAKSSLLERLRTGGPDSYQEDVAQTLTDIYAREFNEVQDTPSYPALPDTNIGVDPEAGKSSFDFPTETVGGVAGVLALAGVAAWQTAGRISVRKLSKEFSKLTDSDTISTAYMSVNNDPTSALVMVNPKDIPKLIKLSEQVNEGFPAWNETKTNTKESIENLRGHFMPPSKKKAQALIKEYHAKSEDYLGIATEFNQELQTVTNKWNEVTKLITDTTKYRSEIEQAVRDLETTSTYDASVFKEELSAMTDSLVESRNLVDQRFASKPYDITAQVKSDLDSMKDFIDNLPAFHKQLEADAIELSANHQNDKTTIDKLEDTVNAILEFHESCWTDNKNNLDDCKKTYAEDELLVSEIGHPEDIFDIRVLKQSAEKIVQLRTNQALIDEDEHNIESAYRELCRLRDELPGDANELEDYQNKAEGFIEEFAIDIEDDTEELIRGFKDSVVELKQALAEDKPRYLAIDKSYQALKSNLYAARKKAEDERQEIIDLLESNDSLSVQVTNAISRAENSVNSDVDSQTRQDIINLDLPELPRARQRAALRQANSLLQSALREAQQALSDAESDKRREENRRAMERAQEQARQAAIAREAAQRAAASHASFSSPSSASRSHHGGGF